MVFQKVISTQDNKIHIKARSWTQSCILFQFKICPNEFFFFAYGGCVELKRLPKASFG